MPTAAATDRWDCQEIRPMAISRVPISWKYIYQMEGLYEGYIRGYAPKVIT